MKKWTFLLLPLFVLFSCSRSIPDRDNREAALEISSWWTAEGENDALTILQNMYTEKNDNYRIINSYVAGGSGANARENISKRLQSGNPPDIFQTLVGSGLIKSHVKLGQLEPLNFLYEEENWTNNFAPAVLQELTYEGNIFAVPLNIHRANLIWYNPELFNEMGIYPLESMNDLIEACEKLADAGITPISLGDKLGWTALHIFENILLSQLGADDFLSLWKGEKSFYDGDVQQSLDYFVTIIGYTNSDHKALSWDDALWNVVRGNSGMTVVGDWADSFLISKGFLRQADYTWRPFPGTEDLYVWLADGFSLPKGAIEREAALDWLKLCGSVEGQQQFNFYKSSIPVRIDMDKSSFSAYQKSAYRDFMDSRLVGSVNHGVLVSDQVWSRLIEIISELVIHKDRDKSLEELEELRKDFLMD